MSRPAPVRPRDRLLAFAAVVVVQLGLGAALLSGFRVDALKQNELISHLIEISLPKPPPPPPPLMVVKPRRAQHRTAAAAAPKAAPKPIGGSPGPQPSHALPTPTPVVAVHPTAAPSGGGTGTGPAIGAGAGGGTGGNGFGADDGGGTDLEKISGDILPSDYPASLGSAGTRRVSVTFTVQTNGRVTNCRVTRSSGIPQLDALTCRLMQERFRFRPSTDRYGRPIPDEVDWDQDWVPR